MVCTGQSAMGTPPDSHNERVVLFGAFLSATHGAHSEDGNTVARGPEELAGPQVVRAHSHKRSKRYLKIQHTMHWYSCCPLQDMQQ